MTPMTHEEGLNVITSEQRISERRKYSSPSNTTKFFKSVLCISHFPTKRSRCKNSKEGKQRRPSFPTKRPQCKNTKEGKQKRPDSQIYPKESKPKKQKERYSIVGTEDANIDTAFGNVTVGDVTDRDVTEEDFTVEVEIKPKKQKDRYSLVKPEDTDNYATVGDVTVGDVTDGYVTGGDEINPRKKKERYSLVKPEDTDKDTTVRDIIDGELTGGYVIKPRKNKERYSLVKPEDTDNNATVGDVTVGDVTDGYVTGGDEINPRKNKERYSLVKPDDTDNDTTVKEFTERDVTVRDIIDRSIGNNLSECSLCLGEYGPNDMFVLRSETCRHSFCVNCLLQYVKIEIQEGRVDLKCPQCPTPMHPNDIEYLSVDNSIVLMYHYLMVQRVLIVDPNTRWCPAPDCIYGVIAGDRSTCPRIDCKREGCEVSFCYLCKEKWEFNHQCGINEEGSEYIITTQVIVLDEDINLRGCPRCSVIVEKEEDGSCNHMKCTVCGCEFCWLCMKEITDLHYMSPSGCTFWGKKRWNKKNKTLARIGTLIGAPLGIGLLAGVSIPAMMIGIPIHVGRKLYGAADKNKSRHTRNLIIAGGVTASTLASPIIAGVTVPIGVIAMLGYTYVAIPISLCRTLGGYVKGTRKNSFKRTSRSSAKIGNPTK